MTRHLSYQITERDIVLITAQKAQRPEKKYRDAVCCVGDFLYLKEYSHAILSHLKRTPDGIRKNDLPARTIDPIAPGDLIQVKLAEEGNIPNITACKTSGGHSIRPSISSANHPNLSAMTSDDISLFTADDFSMYEQVKYVYEDDDILIVNKPAFMPVHASMGHQDDTLAHVVAHRYANDPEEAFVFRCINRLDRDTTGLVLLAKHMLSAAILSADMKQRKIHRTYLGIVSGLLPGDGTIDAPIARVPGSALLREVNEKTGERAVTHYHCQRLLPDTDLTLLSFTLETGRTHQIRVHMQHIGHPLIGDFLYHPDMTYISRQALHSSELTFHHPITKEVMHATAPLPEDMQALL